MRLKLRFQKLKKELISVNKTFHIWELETSNRELPIVNKKFISVNKELKVITEKFKITNKKLQFISKELQIAYSEIKTLNKNIKNS